MPFLMLAMRLPTTLAELRNIKIPLGCNRSQRAVADHVALDHRSGRGKHADSVSPAAARFQRVHHLVLDDVDTAARDIDGPRDGRGGRAPRADHQVVADDADVNDDVGRKSRRTTTSWERATGFNEGPSPRHPREALDRR